MPAEWCRHARTWAAWPGHEPHQNTDALKAALVQILRAVGQYEPVTVIAHKEDKEDVFSRCGRHVDVMSLPHRSPRLRDTGPTFLVDGKGGSAAVDWRFDGWAQRTEACETDTSLTHALLGETEIRRFRAPLTFEGSAFCGDGEGTLIASVSAAMGNQRNASMTKLDIFDVLSRWLGVTRVIWIDESLGDDFGNGEIRRSCAFVARGHVLVGQTADQTYGAALDSIAKRLASTEDAHGQRLRVDRIPLLTTSDGIASYTTFYAFNQAVLVPQYGIDSDDEAASTIGAVFPGRTVIKVDAAEILAASGSLSSLLQYQPARLLERHKATLLPKSAWQRPTPDYIGMLDQYIEQIENED